MAASIPLAYPQPKRGYRVAHVITRLCRGGAQENTFQTVRLHDRQRFQADLIAGPPLGNEGNLEPHIEESGLSIERLPHLIRSPHPLRDLQALQSLTALFKKRAYHIVHTHTSKAGFIGRLAARRAGVPVIVHTSHGNVFHGYFGPWPTNAFVALERRAATWTDALIELTPRSVEECIHHRIGNPDQYRVFPSGIDIDRFDYARQFREPTRKSLNVGDNEILIGAVGRLETIKGMEYFIRAALELGRRYQNLQFRIAGEGSLRPQLEALAKPLGDRLQFLGYCETIPEFMAALDILAVPSLNEGMGRVILEAGAAGVPVVASRTGGIVDVIRDGETGILVAPKDVADLTGALDSLIQHPVRRMAMGSNALCYLGPQYSLDAMVRSIENLYEELLKEKGLET